MRHLVVALTLLVVVLAGCGGGGDDGKLEGKTPEQVTTGWAKVTGDRLVPSGVPTDDWSVLRLPESTDRFGQLGVFSIYVLKTEQGRKVLLEEDREGDTVVKEGNIVWRQSSGSGSWSASRVFGENVLVRWQGGEQRRVDDTYRRLVRTVDAALTGDASRLPEEDRPCRQVGIDPARGREGTCRLDDTVLTVVNSENELKTLVLTAKVASVRTAKTVPPFSRFGRPDSARGRYVIVTYRLRNVGKEPIEFLETKLVIDGRTYSGDFRPEYNLYGGDRPLPAQPAETVTIKAAFDVPADVAARADDGAIILPAARNETGSSLNDRDAQGRIRLAGAPEGKAPSSPGGSGGSGGPGGTGGLGGGGSQERAAAVESALTKFFVAIRSRNIRTVCARVSKILLRTLGGVNGCRGTRVVNLSAANQVPPAGSKPRFTTTTLRNGTRAIVFVRAKNYRATVAMSRESGRWRVRGLTKAR